MTGYNHIVILEKNGEQIGAGEMNFQDLDFDDKSLEAFHVLTPNSIYRCVISDSNIDMRDPDDRRRETLKLVARGKKGE